MSKATAAYGFWDSTLSAGDLAVGSRRLSSIQVDGEYVYWTQADVANPGHRVLLRAIPGQSVEQALVRPANVKTRVHEYGGGEFLVRSGKIFFAVDEDQSWWCQMVQPDVAESSSVWQLLARGDEGQSQEKNVRYADPDLGLNCAGEQVVLVREQHFSAQQVVNDLVIITFASASAAASSSVPTTIMEVLATGHDFYANPRFSHDGQKLCFIAWDHPQMPWDGCMLYEMQRLPGGGWTEPALIAGGIDEAIYQPSYGKGGQLFFVSNRSGWGNLYAYHDGQTRCLLAMEVEFGAPQWVFASNRYAELASGKLLAVASHQASEYLLLIDPQTGECERLACPYTSYGDCLEVYQDGVVFLGGASDRLPAIIYFNLVEQTSTIVQEESSYVLPKDHVAEPVSITVNASFAPVATATTTKIQAFFYKPHHPFYKATSDMLPPLIVFSHGGPTAMTDATLNLKIQFWTSRGFAVVDVNYGGSTGFGKAYQQRLAGQWGVVDVQDCLDCVKYLIANKLVDERYIFIRGSSAGGFTALTALIIADLFTAGTSLYGVGDLEALASDTHKFEAHYLDGLLGPYPECRALYQLRSPLNNLDKLTCPVLLLQGSDDKVVPKEQSLKIAQALARMGIEYQYEEFAGEGHGFRKPEAIARALELELSFYQKMMRPARSV